MQNQNNSPLPANNNFIYPQPSGTVPVPNQINPPPPMPTTSSQLPPQLPIAPPTAPTSIPTKIPTMSAQDAQDLQNIASKANRRLKKGLLKKILLAVVVIFVLGAGAYFALKFKPADVTTLLGKKGEIVWWGFQLDEADVATLIEEYQGNNSNIKITYVKQSPVDYRVRLANALASGNGPDIFEIHNSWPAMFKNELATLPSSIMDKAEFAQTFYPIIVSDLTLGGEIIGMPLEYDAITLYINEDIFAAGAKRPPETWDELRLLVAELTQRDENEKVIQPGIAMGTIDNVDHWPEVIALMMFQNGVNLAKPTEKSAGDALKYYHLFLKDKIWNATFPSSTTYFARGRVAMYFGPARRAFEIVQINPSLKFKTVPLPQLPKETPQDPDMSYATYWVQGVWEKSTNMEASWKFLKYLSTKESLEKLNQNISGKTNLRRMSPRIDSAYSFVKDPILGSIVALVASSKSWYLADETYDGLEGINSQINEIYKGIVNNGKKGNISEDAINSISTLFSQHGISAK